jgi:hypothetical protein
MIYKTDPTIPVGTIYLMSPRKYHMVEFEGETYKIWDESEEEWGKRCAIIYNIGIKEP